MRFKLCCAVVLLLTGKFVLAADAPQRGVRLGDAHKQRLRFGMIVTAGGGTCKGIYGTAPIPTDWPEQTVEIIKEEMSPFVKKVDYRVLSGTVKQMLVEIPLLPGGEEARALVTVEITRHKLLAPEDTSVFVLPKKMDKQVRTYLGDSPFIETRHAKIKALSKQIMQGKSDLPAWQQVETIYDWVRDNVEYKNQPLKGALKAYEDKNGDCEELSSLFIALCRANDIPARTVWVPGHCYPEFYLEDAEGKGYWLPCQAAGTRAFGSIPETRAILQKGDNFKVPEKPRDKERYVAEFLRGEGGQPQVRFIREAADELK